MASTMIGVINPAHDEDAWKRASIQGRSNLLQQGALGVWLLQDSCFVELIEHALVAKTGDEQDRQGSLRGADSLSEFDAVHLGHCEVGNYKVHIGIAFDQTKRFPSASRWNCRKSEGIKHPQGRPKDDFVVIDDEDGRLSF